MTIANISAAAATNTARSASEQNDARAGRARQSYCPYAAMLVSPSLRVFQRNNAGGAPLDPAYEQPIIRTVKPSQRYGIDARA